MIKHFSFNFFNEENYCINNRGNIEIKLGDLKNSWNFLIKSIKLCIMKKREFYSRSLKTKNIENFYNIKNLLMNFGIS